MLALAVVAAACADDLSDPADDLASTTTALESDATAQGANDATTSTAAFAFDDPAPASSLSSAFCPNNSGQPTRIDATDLRAEWATIEPNTPAEFTLESGAERDSVQFAFDDGTIVQGSAHPNNGQVFQIFVISQVDPQQPTADLASYLGHWRALLAVTEPDLTTDDHIGILSELNALGEGLDLTTMGGAISCQSRSYELAFDIELAAFIMSADLER